MHPHLASRIFDRAHLIEPAAGRTIIGALQSRLDIDSLRLPDGTSMDAAALADAAAAAPGREKRPLFEQSGSIAIIRAIGTLTHRFGYLDPVSGAILTVTDGRWIIAIGVYGWIGFLAEFGLLVTPFFLLWRGSRELGADRLSPYIAPMSLILAVNVADLIPNATLTPLTWLLAGALTGYAERMKVAPTLSQVTPGTPGTPSTAKREVEWQSIM